MAEGELEEAIKTVLSQFKIEELKKEQFPNVLELIERSPGHDL